MHVFIYEKQKNCETFLYTKIQIICKKQDNLRYVSTVWLKWIAPFQPDV